MDSGDHACKLCRDKFSTVRGLNIHMNVHKDRFNTPDPSTTRDPSTTSAATNSQVKAGMFALIRNT